LLQKQSLPNGNLAGFVVCPMHWSRSGPQLQTQLFQTSVVLGLGRSNGFLNFDQLALLKIQVHRCRVKLPPVVREQLLKK